MEVSTCVSHLSLIVGIDVMLFCLHLCIATLQANPAWCHPELSRLNHIVYAMNWSLHYTGRLMMLTWGKFASQQWSHWSDNCGRNTSLELNRLHVTLYCTFNRLLSARKPVSAYIGSIQHNREVRLITEQKMIFSGKKVSPVNKDTQWGEHLFSLIKN